VAEVGDLFLGRYSLLEKHEAPAFVSSFVATDKNLNRSVEVTILASRFAAHREFATRFVTEAKRVMTLDHPAIARIYDVGSDERQSLYYLIAEHVQGTTLSRYVRTSQPSSAEAAKLFEAILGGLAQAHASAVDHLGLTPANILVTAAGRPRITNLGLLGFAANLAGSADALASSLGTSGYLAPEQILTAQGSSASDVYAAGLLFSEALTGRPTWDGSLSGDDLARRASVAAALPITVLPQLDPELNGLIGRCLAREAAERPSARDVADLLVTMGATTVNSVVASTTVAVSLEPELPETKLIETVAEPARGVPSSVPSGIDPQLAKVFPPSSLSTREFSANEFTAGRTRSAMVSTVVIAVASVVAFAAIILFVVSTLPSNFLPSTSRIVPNVVGMTYEQALSAVNSAGLTVSRTDEPSATVPADAIISSSPSAGAQVEVGSTVALAVSTGSTKIPVPNVVGMTLTLAKTTLTKAGLTVGSTAEIASALAAKGAVVATLPAVGTDVAAGTTINLSLANGLVRIPSLVGKSITDASATLLAPGIGITPIIKSSSGCAATNPISVATQSPAAGDIPLGTQVTLTYCSGR